MPPLFDNSSSDPPGASVGSGAPLAPLVAMGRSGYAAIAPGHSVTDALRLLLEREAARLLVAEPGGPPLGIVSERAVLAALTSGDPSAIPIGDLVASPPLLVPQTLDLAAARRCLREAQVSHLVVVDDNGGAVGLLGAGELSPGSAEAGAAGVRPVVSVMNRAVARLPPEGDLHKASRLILAQGGDCAVITQGGRPVGLITLRELLRRRLHDPASLARPLREIETPPARTLPADATLQAAAALMRESGTDHLVVVYADGGGLAGLLCEADLSRALLGGDGHPQQAEPAPLLPAPADAICAVPEITALGQAQEALAAREEAFRSLAENSPDNIIRYDLACRAIYVNERLARTLGEDVSALLGRTPRQTGPEGFADDYQAVLERVIALGVPDETELVLQGEPARTHLIHFMPERDRRGRIIGALAYGRDITERKRMVQALAARERNFRSMAENLPDNIARWDCQGRYLYINPTLERLLRVRLDQIAGREIDDRYAHIKTAIARVIATGDAALSVRETTLDAHGGTLIHEVSLVPEFDESGKVVSVLGVGRDMTEVYHLQESLAARAQEFRSLAENSPDHIIRYDRQCRQIYANALAAALMQKLLGRNPMGETPNQAHPKGGFAAYDAALRRVIATGSTEDFEIVLPDTGEGVRHHLIRMAAEKSEAGEVVGVVAIGRDITERKQVEDRLQQSLREFNELVDRIPDGVFRLCHRAVGEWRFEYVSPRWCEIMELESGVVLNDPKAVLRQIHAEELAGFLNRVRRAARSPWPFEWEGRIVRQEGVRWILIQSNPAQRPDGDTLWSGIVHDVTERRLADENRRLAASVFAYSHEGIVITDADARIVEVNDAFSRITGYERGEVLGQNPRILRSGHQDSVFYASMWHDITRNGHWSGEVWNRRKDGEVYAEYLTISSVRNDSGVVTHYAGVFADITPLKEQEQRLERIAHFDALTGMPNRALLADRLNQAIAQARRSGALVAVCYLDLDDFAPINERFGAAAGDRLLVNAAARLNEHLRGGDTVARISGDEFVLLLTHLTDLDACAAVLQRLLETVSRPTEIEGQPVAMSASIGVTIYPLDSADPDTLLRHADQAMYRAKQEGKNRYHLYNPEQDKKLQAHRQSIERLAAALENGEFLLYYQPKVDLRDGRVIGAEALIRWQHPERGLVPPLEFLPLLKGSELEIAVGEWVIDTALARIARWQADGFEMTVSVNVSADHIMRPEFAERLRTILARHPAVAPDSLELEILESAAISDLECATRTLEAVAAMGVGFALDDFGTGYSSLSYFSKLPVDVLKIDQNFVRNMLVDPENLSIIESIVFLAQAFNRPVVAEGVETLQHYAVLLHLGCRFGQGYGIARPMPPDKLAGWMAEWQERGSWHTIPTIDLPKEDVVLLVAAASHRQWIDEVAACLENPERPRPPLYKRQCRFGRWYHGNGFSRYGHMPGYVALGPIHERVHRLAAELLDPGVARDRDTALGRLHELHALRDQFLAQLEGFIALVKAR